jgi:hypothetical protein
MKPDLIDGRLLDRFPEGVDHGTDFLAEVAAGHSDPDALFFTVISIVPKIVPTPSDIVALTTLRGFLRPVQKVLEGKR